MKVRIFRLLFLFTCCFFSILSTIYAQEKPIKKLSKWTWSIEGGYNAAQFRPFNPLPDTISHNARRKTGISVGLGLNYQFTDIFSLEFGAFYAGKGTSYGFPNGDNVIFAENERPILFQLDYIEMPLLAKLRLPQRNFYITGFTGIVPAYLVSSKLILPQVDYNKRSIEYKVITWDETYHFDLGLTVGAGIELKVGRNKVILIDARYTMGTCNIARTTRNGRNEVWGAMIGFGF